MTIGIKSNSGNGDIADSSIISFSFSEEVSSIGPSNITGGTGSVSISAVSIDDDITQYNNNNSIMLIGNDIVLSDSDMGDIAFSVKTVNVSNGVVSLSGPTTQTKMNVIKTALHHSGTLKTAIEYYCSLVDVTPSFDGTIGTHLAAVSVNLLGWEDSVWNKLKELIAVKKAYDATRVSTTPPVLNDGYYNFEMYIETATNTIHFREALSNEIVLDEVLSDKSFSVDSFDASRSVETTGYITSKKSDFILPIYETKQDNNNNTDVRSSVDFSGTTFNANETAERFFDMDTHITDLVQPRCVSTISRIPYRKAMGNVNLIEYTPTGGGLGVLKFYTQSYSYQNTPSIGELSSTTMSSGPLAGTTVNFVVYLSDQTARYYGTAGYPGGTSPFSSSIVGTYESLNATGEYVIVGDGDVPIDPDQWVDQGGSLIVSKTDIPGQIKITITAPVTDNLPSADDPNTYVNGPFQVGVEVADGADYPACWLLATGVSFEKKTVEFLTGADPVLTTKEASTTIQNIFINSDSELSDMGMMAAQEACGPKVSMNATTVDPSSFNSLVGSVAIENNNNYRITSVSHNGYSAGIEAEPMMTIAYFNEIMGTKSFDEFDTVVPELRFNEFTILPRVSA